MVQMEERGREKKKDRPCRDGKVDPMSNNQNDGGMLIVDSSPVKWGSD